MLGHLDPPVRRVDSLGCEVGSVLGFNMFNVFFTLGVTALIHSAPLDLALNQVVIASVAVPALLVVRVTLPRRHQTGRPLGFVPVAPYAVYLIVSLQG